MKLKACHAYHPACQFSCNEQGGPLGYRTLLSQRQMIDENLLCPMFPFSFSILLFHGNSINELSFMKRICFFYWQSGFLQL